VAVFGIDYFNVAKEVFLSGTRQIITRSNDNPSKEVAQ
jgi:hypothetical protein